MKKGEFSVFSTRATRGLAGAGGCGGLRGGPARPNRLAVMAAARVLRVTGRLRFFRLEKCSSGPPGLHKGIHEDGGNDDKPDDDLLEERRNPQEVEAVSEHAHGQRPDERPAQ